MLATAFSCCIFCSYIYYKYSFLPIPVEPITLSSDIINFSRDHEEAVSACLTVEAMGTSPVYKWFRNEVPLTDSADFKDASCPTLCINKADLSGKYRCEVSNTRSKRARKTLTYHSKFDLVCCDHLVYIHNTIINTLRF